jgi:hypothetical protein
LSRRSPDFEREGIPTDDPLARKLWAASVVQGHRDPFGKKLIDYTVPELDFVLEMAAIDDPDRWSFTRIGGDGPRSVALSGWTNSLAGRALMAFLARTNTVSAVKGIAAWRSRREQGQTGMRPGFTRGGKEISPRARDKD